MTERRSPPHGIIVLDGPDCSGKSTLAKVIALTAEQAGGTAEIWHSPLKEKADCWADHSTGLLEAIKKAFTRGHERVVVVDRFFMSEAIYGLEYRGGSVYPEAARHLDRLLHRFRALRVLCLPPAEEVIKRHKERFIAGGEAYRDITGVIARYEALWDGNVTPRCLADESPPWLPLPREEYVAWLTSTGGVQDRAGWYKYDMLEDGEEPQVYADFLLNELEQERLTCDPCFLDPEQHRFTGAAHASSILFIGDRLSGPNALSIPFYANSGCSLYLAKTFQKLGVNEDSVAIANINDEQGVDEVRELIDVAGFRKIIALGRMAERTLLQEGIDFDASVRHPQHTRRFDYNNDTYAEELAEVLAHD